MEKRYILYIGFGNSIHSVHNIEGVETDDAAVRAANVLVYRTEEESGKLCFIALLKEEHTIIRDSRIELTKLTP